MTKTKVASPKKSVTKPSPVKKVAAKSSPAKKTAVPKKASTAKPPAAKKAATKTVKASAKKTEPKHDLNDKDVVAAQDNLSELLQGYDNAGVSMVEADYRKLSDEDKRQGDKWQADWRVGALRPVPVVLRKFATKELLSWADDYLNNQDEQRKVLMPVRYGKPSPTKSQGDDGEPKIKMGVLVPLKDISPGTAEQLWGGVRCRVEFCLRAVRDFQEELPGTESILSCETEIKGYTRKMREWQFSFFVVQSIISIEDAFDLFWGNGGSVRITPLGPMERNQPEASDPPKKAIKPDPAQPSLFDPDSTPIKQKGGKKQDYRKMLDDKGKEFTAPDEYLIPMPLSGEEHSTMISVGEGPNGQFYASAYVAYLDEDQDEDEQDWGNPIFEGDGCVSGKAAVEKRLETLIEYFMKEGEYPNIVEDFRNELKRLNGGGEPTVMPDE